MRKIIFLMHVTLDGFVSGPNGEMDWIRYDDEIEKYSHELHQTTDTAIYGRTTYQMMESYWPTVLDDPTAGTGEMNHAHWLETAIKIAVSTTMDSVTWKNSVLIRDNVAEEITRIKQQPGKDMWLIGSPTLAQSFMRFGLIDEYRLNINPIVLGKGKRLFDGVPENFTLNLIEARMFKCGVAGLRYEPVTK